MKTILILLFYTSAGTLACAMAFATAYIIEYRKKIAP
jgi:hypothetical protein